MSRDVRKFLFDMLSSCDFLIGLAANKGLADYQQDRVLRSAVQHELQIIGEALMQLARIDPKLAARVPEHDRIISFRHVLVHGYGSLDPNTVWTVVESRLSPLANSLRALLAELDRNP